MNKEADALSYVWDAIKGLGSTGAELAKDTYKHVDKLAWLLAPATGLLGVVAAVNALNPKAVADNADKYAELEAIKASLGSSIRQRQLLEAQRKAEQEYGNIKKYDRFVG